MTKISKLCGKIRRQAPWPIPPQAKSAFESKQGYQQIKFSWQAQDWRYEARYHQPIPSAKLIRYPSWRLDRVQPGKGFGPDHRPHRHEILAGKHWVSAQAMRYAAARLEAGEASSKQIQLLRACHFHGRL